MANARLRGIIDRLTRIPERIPLKDRRKYSICVFAGFLGNLLHLGFLLTFLLLRIDLMFWFNFISVAVWLAILFLIVRFQTYSACMAIATIEIVAHQVLAVVCVGWAAGFQYLLIMVVIEPFLIMPEARMRFVVSLAVLPCLAFLALAMSFPGRSPIYELPPAAAWIFSAFNIASMLLVLTLSSYLFAHYVNLAEDKADREFERAEGLLLNILPKPIAERLKADPSTIADGFDCASVLFCDIVDFTKLSARLSAPEVVGLLNGLFSRFDAVAGSFGLEKIKTIGDAYMVAAGIPERCEDHAERLAEFALQILEEIRAFNDETDYAISMRVGINSGPVVAGVIGKKKFIYDLWGDAVNTASRMESQGLPGRIQVTEGSYELLKEKYEFEDRGLIEVKGKGSVRTYLMCGQKGAVGQAATRVEQTTTPMA
jgi:adenylate cyclase